MQARDMPPSRAQAVGEAALNAGESMGEPEEGIMKTPSPAQKTFPRRGHLFLLASGPVYVNSLCLARWASCAATSPTPALTPSSCLPISLAQGLSLGLDVSSSRKPSLASSVPPLSAPQVSSHGTAVNHLYFPLWLWCLAHWRYLISTWNK